MLSPILATEWKSGNWRIEILRNSFQFTELRADQIYCIFVVSKIHIENIFNSQLL